MPNNKYTNEFKKKVIDEYVSGNESFYSLERKYNISNSSIRLNSKKEIKLNDFFFYIKLVFYFCELFGVHSN